MKKLLILTITITLLLTACQSSPTPDLEALRTSVAQTVVAEITASAPRATPTMAPTKAPTATPTLAATPTPPASPTPTEDQRPCDDAAYVSDVTIPDYYADLKPGELFVKTWQIKNTGSCTWTPDYRLVFGYGEAMNGKSQPIGQEVAPEQTVEVSVTLTAPLKSGTYTGAWRMSNALGDPFGEFLLVVITMP